MSNESLYTTADTKRVREELLEIQEGRCAVTNLPIPDKQAVLDHDHETQFVRAVLHRQINVFEGKVTNAFKRYLSWNSEKNLPEILRALANYLEKDYSVNPYHPDWKKKVVTQFKKLNSKEQNEFLKNYSNIQFRNTNERLCCLKKLINNRSINYEDWLVYEKKLCCLKKALNLNIEILH